MRSFTFFVDRCLGLSVKEALIEIGEHAVYHDDCFEQDTLDEVWLLEVASRGWIVLTADQKIKHNQLERQAVISSNAMLFVLISHGLTGKQSAQAFVGAISKIKRFAQDRNPPFIAKLYSNSKLELLPSDSFGNKRRQRKNKELLP
jgi:PIN like domain